MCRVLSLAALAFVLSGCRVAPDQAPLRQLADEGQVYTYSELLGRARMQAQVALEAFYVDNWTNLEEVAKALEQTARFLPKTNEIPARLKDRLSADTSSLSEDAIRLRDAARNQDVNQANESLQRIHLRIRGLRVDPPPAKNPENE